MLRSIKYNFDSQKEEKIAGRIYAAEGLIDGTYEKTPAMNANIIVAS